MWITPPSTARRSRRTRPTTMPAILRCDPSRFDQPACGSILRNPLRPEEIPSPPTTLQSLGASLKRAFIPPSTSPYTRPTAQQAIDERKKREQAEAKKRNASPSSPPRAEVPLEAPKDDGPLLAPTLPKSPSIKFAPLPPSPQRTRRANSITIGRSTLCDEAPALTARQGWLLGLSC